MVGAITFEPFVGDGRPGDIAAEVLQFFTLIGAPRSAAWRLKPCALTRSSGADGLAALGQALQAQHFLPSSWSECDTIGARGGLQRRERAIRIRFGEVGHALFFDEISLARQ